MNGLPDIPRQGRVRSCCAAPGRRVGRADERFGGAQVWVLPNPSGLNRAFPLDRLVEAYAALRERVSIGDAANVAQKR